MEIALDFNSGRSVAGIEFFTDGSNTWFRGSVKPEKSNKLSNDPQSDFRC
jgi:hypothetical protein